MSVYRYLTKKVMSE